MTKNMKRVHDVIDRWKPRLELEHWSITVVLKKEDEPAHKGTVAAEVEPNVLYKNATLTVYPASFAGQDEDLEETIVHELCHCATQEYKDLFDKYVFKDKHVTVDQEHETNERLTNWITRMAFVRFDESDRTPKRKAD